MSKIKDQKTNVMRVLDKHKINYSSHFYGDTDAIGGVEVAKALNENPDQVYKTLVTVGKTMEHYVFIIPVAEELDLKKAAKSVGEKNIEMIKNRELLPLTGYIHGGCSPIGMKKKLVTVFDETIMNHETIFVSGGKVGYQVELSPRDFEKVMDHKIWDLKK